MHRISFQYRQNPSPRTAFRVIKIGRNRCTQTLRPLHANELNDYPNLRA
jgi:hypothetical protein